MLRFKILVSAVPLIAFAALTRGGLVPGPHPCITVGETSVQIAALPWQAGLHVSFTGDPQLATVRVQIADSAETADFVVVDDVDAAESNACEAASPPQLVTISSDPTASAPVIFLSQDGPADYRIFVKSTTFTPRDAAALIVGARGGHPRLASASL